MAKFESLTDQFKTTALQPSLWTLFTDATTLPTATYNLGVNTQFNFPVSTTVATDIDLTSVTTWDLTNSYVLLNVQAVPTAASAADADFRVQTAANNWIRWVQEGGTLFAQYDVAGAKSTPFSVAYSSTTHAWWRIREGTGAGAGGTAGNVYWDTSVDGKNWTQQATAATPITVTALTQFIGGIGTGTAASPGTFTFSNYNTPPNVTRTIVRASSKWVGPPALRRTFRMPVPAYNSAEGFAVLSATVTQLAATLTFTGGTQSIASIQNATAAQVAATLTFTGGTQAILAVSSGTVAQVAATLTFTGGTQVAASVVNATLAQVAATLTFNGGTQVIATVNNKTVAQVAATLTFTGGTQAIATSNFSTVAQVAATLTFTGGTQVSAASRKASVAQVAATLTFTGGTQVGASSNLASVTQVAAMLTFTGGTQVLVAAFVANVAQSHATLIFTGGVQSVFIPAILLKMIELVMAAPDVLPISITKNVLPISVEKNVLPISIAKPAPISMTLAVDNSLVVASTNNIIPIRVVAPAPIAFTVTAN